jgi:hypothetical protein
MVKPGALCALKLAKAQRWWQRAVAEEAGFVLFKRKLWR